MSILLACLGLALGGVCLFALLSNVIFWYEALNSPCEELPPPRPSFGICFVLFVRTIAGHLMGCLSHPVGWAMKPLFTKKASVQEVETPILFIHGIYHNAGTWAYLRWFLEKRGCFCATYSYHSFFWDISTIVQRFDAAVAALEKEHGKKPLIIAHSLGGIITRKWLLTQGNEARIAGIITLATPHGGSKLAVLAQGALAHQLIPDSDLLRQLQEESIEPSVPCVSLCSCADEAVLPAASLVPPAGWQLRCMGTPSHIGMLFRHDTAKVVWEEVQKIQITDHK